LLFDYQRIYASNLWRHGRQTPFLTADTRLPEAALSLGVDSAEVAASLALVEGDMSVILAWRRSA